MDFTPAPPPPSANGFCPRPCLPVPAVGPVPGGATALMPATGVSWGGNKSSVGSARPAWAAPRPCRRTWRDRPPAAPVLPEAGGGPVRTCTASVSGACRILGVGLQRGRSHPVTGRAGGWPPADVAGSGRDMVVHRGRKATGGRGPGPQGRAAGPAPERPRLASTGATGSRVWPSAGRGS